MNRTELNESFIDARRRAWTLVMAIRGLFSNGYTVDAEVLEALALESVQKMDQLHLAATTMLTVVLASVGDRKIEVIKEVRALTGLGLKEAKELVERAPVALDALFAEEEANDMKRALEGAGSSVLLV